VLARSECGAVDDRTRAVEITGAEPGIYSYNPALGVFELAVPVRGDQIVRGRNQFPRATLWNVTG
jgi:hypothetical protein